MMRERNRLLLNRLSILNLKLMMKTDRLWLYVILLSNYDHLFNDFKLSGSCHYNVMFEYVTYPLTSSGW